MALSTSPTARRARVIRPVKRSLLAGGRPNKSRSDFSSRWPRLPPHALTNVVLAEWIGELLTKLSTTTETLNQERRRLLARIAIQHLEPTDLTHLFKGGVSFPAKVRCEKSAWINEFFAEQPAAIMRAACQTLAAGSDSVFETPYEIFDLQKVSSTIFAVAPTLTNFLRRLVDSSRPSREKGLSESRKRIKKTRVASIVSQIVYTRSQRKNAFQTFLGVQFKFSGLSKNVCVARYLQQRGCYFT